MALKNVHRDKTRSFTPLDAGDLISRVAQGASSTDPRPAGEPDPQPELTEPPAPKVDGAASSTVSPETVVPGKKSPPVVKVPSPVRRIRFELPERDYEGLIDTVREIERELGSFDLANMLRGWVTRTVTAHKELSEAARTYADKHGKLKRPNSRNPSEVASVDHALFEIQALAFRRTPRGDRKL